MLDPPLVRLQLFGALSILAMGDREAAAALTQPKRVALLAYLAAASPFGFHRRDSLLALFWPEADKDHARTSLRKAIHFLRHELGAAVVIGRGDEEVGIDPTQVWCDVREFDRRLTAGELTDALALYRGDLMPGFFVPDAPEFERWLDDERHGLRQRAAETAWTVADRLERAGEPDNAAKWARWALACTPDDEPAVRRLMTLLGRLGDRAGAIRAYDEVTTRLRREYEVTPSTETRQLAETVRQSDTAAVRPTHPRPPPEAGLREDEPLAREDEPTAVAPPSKEYIAVLPFTVHGDGSAMFLREGLVDLLTTNLDHAGMLFAIDPHALLSRLALESGALVDPARAAAVAAELGAQLYVSGSVVGVAGQLRISACLHHQTPVQGPARFVTAAGPADQLFELVDDLTAKLLAELHPGPGARLSRLAASTTDSLTALKAYLAGERALRAGRYSEAIEAFEQAVAEDAEFALAWYRLAFFLAWPTLPQPRESWKSIERALGRKHRLSDRERMLLVALSASLSGRAAVADRLYREIVAVHPDDVEAWLGLGQTLVFHNPQRGRLITESRTAFERVLELDPGHTIASLFLTYVAEREGKVQEADRLIAASRLRSEFVYPRIVQAFRRKDSAAEAEAMELLRRAPDCVAYEAVRFVATLTSDFVAARRIARLLDREDRPPGVHGIAHILLAFLELASGHRAAARDELALAAPLHPASALEYRGLVAALPFLPPDQDELAATRTALERWDASAVLRTPYPLPAYDVHHDAYRVIRLYLLGVLASRNHDPEAMDRAAELDASIGSPDVESLARDLARSVRARLSAGRGDAVAALGQLEQAPMESRCTYIVMQSPFYTYAAERWLRAELLERLERFEAALRWYEAMVQASVYNLPYLAPSHLARARIYHRLGDEHRAASHYHRAAGLWHDCDVELRRMLEETASHLRLIAGAR
jgi:DNA-binding SARP family transcriptional activator